MLTNLGHLNNDLKLAGASRMVLLIIGRSLLNTKCAYTKLEF